MEGRARRLLQLFTAAVILTTSQAHVPHSDTWESHLSEIKAERQKSKPKSDDPFGIDALLADGETQMEDENGGSWNGGNIPESPGPSFQNPKSHNFFINDRVVRKICKALQTLASTGEVILPTRRKRRTDEATQRCGWWKSACISSGACGFKWISCSDLKTGGSDFTENKSSNMFQNGNSASGRDDEESELMLKLLSPEERKKRFNTTNFVLPDNAPTIA